MQKVKTDLKLIDKVTKIFAGLFIALYVVNFVVIVGYLVKVTISGTFFNMLWLEVAFVSMFVIGMICFFIEGPSKVISMYIELIKYINPLRTKKLKVALPYRSKMLEITSLFFSVKTQKEVFLQIVFDWDEEIFEALKENKDANLFMINVRNTYGFIMAMWQKSPLGDLLEYVRKIAS
jgi:hypothetical protein